MLWRRRPANFLAPAACVCVNPKLNGAVLWPSGRTWCSTWAVSAPSSPSFCASRADADADPPLACLRRRRAARLLQHGGHPLPDGHRQPDLRLRPPRGRALLGRGERQESTIVGGCRCAPSFSTRSAPAHSHRKLRSGRTKSF